MLPMPMPESSPKTTRTRVMFRWFAGRPLDGRPRTDASFWRAGTRSVRAHVTRPSRWSMLAGWQRTAVRQGVVAAAVASGLGWWTGHGRTVLVVWSLAVAVVLSVVGFRAVRALRRARHEREWVRPLGEALAGIVGHPEALHPRVWLTIPPEVTAGMSRPRRTLRERLPFAVPALPELVERLPFSVPSLPARPAFLSLPSRAASSDEEVPPVVVHLPSGWRPDPGAQSLVAATVKTRLGLEASDARWQLVGAQPSVRFVRSPQPPSRVGLAQIRELIDQVPESAPMLGLGVRGAVVSVDLDDDAPHIGLSAGTGAGKSVFARLLSTQVLRNGGRTVFIDPKRVSHMWARGVPGVAYASSPKDMHEALCAVGVGIDGRYGWIEQTGDESACQHFPRILVVVEEVNALIGILTRYWAEIRTPEDPKQSPAVAALGMGLFMGRQGKVHFLTVGQLLTVKALGGPEVRACLGCRALARAPHSAWRMLAPEVNPIPRASRVPGRMHVVLAGEVRAVQVGFLTPAECIELAREGQERLGLALPAGASVAEVLASASSPVVVGELVDAPASRERLEVAPAPAGLVLPTLEGWSDGPPSSEPVQPGPKPVQLAGVPDGDGRPALRLVVPPIGLTAACAPGGPLEGMSVSAARKARQRDAAFPASVTTGNGREQLYRPEDLARWARNRPRAETPAAQTDTPPSSGVAGS